jgi:leader peptidase (prepilin peptidase) / N-methyltransferase
MLHSIRILKRCGMQATYTGNMGMSLIAFELPALLLGLLFGSFLNVCISRLPDHRSISTPRSHCPQCKQMIRWYDNVPLLSFLILRGHCRHCGVKIPWRYPLVELAIGCWFTYMAVDAVRILPGWAASSPDGMSQALVSFADATILGFLLIGLAVMDWRDHKLPDAFTITGTVIGFLLVCTQAIFLSPGEDDIKLNPKHSLRMSSPGSFVAKGNVFLTGPEHLVFGRVAAIAGAALILIVIRALYKAIRKREGLGLGDVKLLAMIAALLGFWPAVLALFFGVILCTVYAVTLLARRKAHTLTQLPLGTFLCIGGLLSIIFGDILIPWYRSLL